MLITHEITTNLTINSLMDLNKLKHLEESSNLKVNKSKMARKFNVDRRTIAKYIDGYTKPTTRKSKSKMDGYYQLIEELLSCKHKVFAYKRVLWQYLKDNHGLDCAESSFRRYISSIDEFNAYFKCKTKVSSPTIMRFETKPGEQAQLDWKESQEFVLDTGEVISINIFVCLLSFSRFRIYRLSLSKTQDVLFHFLNETFEAIGGVPEVLVTDNMKTVMDEPRTEYRRGKVNNKFQQFADDYGFKVHPCIAGRPNTKAKVESPMKILDELKAYSGDLSYSELSKKVNEINERENKRYHAGYQTIPVLGLEKEKDSLKELPPLTLRKSYSVITTQVKVNQSSMISYKSNHYSVPPEYIDKRLTLQVYDSQIHLYHNTQLVAIHSISKQKLNYLEEHYIQITKRTLSFKEEDIHEFAKSNLTMIGEKYKT